MKDQFSSHSSKLSYLANLTAQLTEIENAFDRFVKSLIIDNFGESRGWIAITLGRLAKLYKITEQLDGEEKLVTCMD